MAEAIVSMVVGRITDLLIEEPLLLHRVEGEIQLVVTELMRLKTFLPDADSRIDEDKIRILLAEVLHLAYSAEHAVESFLVKAISYPGKTIQWMNTRKACFDGLAWVSISQKWEKKQVLQRILVCLDHEKKEEILAMNVDSLVKNLIQIQEKKKCLIVLDDIWSNDARDSSKDAFTAEGSLSKLMLTSRNVEVAEHVNPRGLYTSQNV
ncbi:hypothetical protein ACET3Z_004697 [Daucus carota]